MTLPPIPSRMRPEEFESLFGTHRRELQAHCYRMTGSLADAEDLTQEVFLRAWRNLERFEGRSSPRTWLYRICTNVCLDFLKSHKRRAQPTESITETLERETWIDPYPDPGDPAEMMAREVTTDLYLTAALLHLPSRQRAVFIARDLLDLDAAQTASILGCSVPATNSLRQRAHAQLRRLALDVDNLARPTDADQDDLVRRYIDAHHRGDADAILELLDTDVRISMPPEPPCIGAYAAAQFFNQLLGPDGPGSWLLTPTRANGCPATANYLRRSDDAVHRALSIDILRLRNGRIAAIHCFLGDKIFRVFGFDIVKAKLDESARLLDGQFHTSTGTDAAAPHPSPQVITSWSVTH